MAQSGSASTTVDAPASEVMAVIADFGDYPSWAKQVERTEVLETGPDGRARRVRFQVSGGGISDEYVLEYDWDDDRAVTWSLVEGRTQRDQQGSYRLTETGGSTRVDYELAVDLKIKMPGFLVRKAQKSIMSTAVEELRAEVVRRSGGS